MGAASKTSRLADGDRAGLGVVPATVSSVRADGRVFTREAGQRPVVTALAVAGGYAPRAGDAVLLAFGQKGERYLVGVLSPSSAPPGPRPVAAPVTGEVRGALGARASEADGRLRVHDERDRLLFEYDPVARRSVVCAPEGDLVFRAPGDVQWEAGGALRMDAARAVSLRAGDPADGASSSVDLQPEALAVVTPRLSAHAESADLVAAHATLTAEALTVVADVARHTVGVLETEAERVIERAGSVYRDVAELCQTTAGRMRIVVAATLHVFGKRALFKAEQDMKLKADKIHLA